MFCRFRLQFFKTNSGSETGIQGNTSTNNQTTGFTNRAVSMEMKHTDGRDGVQREDEGYEKLRVESSMYEEIPESVNGHLDPQMPD